MDGAGRDTAVMWVGSQRGAYRGAGGSWVEHSMGTAFGGGYGWASDLGSGVYLRVLDTTLSFLLGSISWILGGRHSGTKYSILSGCA